MAGTQMKTSVVLIIMVSIVYSQRTWAGGSEWRGRGGDSGVYPQPSSVDGEWGGWSEWSSCSGSCGGGKQTRDRVCDSPRPAHGGADCPGLSNKNSQLKICNAQPCAVDGEWDDWTSWTPCSATCGGGVKTKSRSCTKPEPSGGGSDCSGSRSLRRRCNLDVSCAVHGGWTDWSVWGDCSANCRGGTKRKTRTCTSPTPANGGRDCSGSLFDDADCNQDVPCEVNGGWSSWTEWGSCTSTCRGGIKGRTRACTNPEPAYGGQPCDGPATESHDCNEDVLCFVDGGWEEWTSWGRCSASCGGGLTFRSRRCTNPAPVNGGADCIGRRRNRRPCNTDVQCAVAGGWSDWNDWGVCSASCGGGWKSHHRSCTNPEPEYGGSECGGNSSEDERCNDDISCAVDGGWVSWSEWSTCSTSCGSGIKRKFRTCTNPPPSDGGYDCDGSAVKDEECNQDIHCRVDGEWSEWMPWTRCSATCGSSTRTRQRTCSNPPPVNGGSDCEGSSIGRQRCGFSSCAVDGGWTTWNSWSFCSVSCGEGTQTRDRSCSNPRPAHGGAQCDGQTMRIRRCSERSACPVQGRWSDWSDYSDCSNSCGNGSQTRMRVCNNPAPSNGGDGCTGLSSESINCRSTSQCGVNGGWGGWSIWSGCSVTCGSGIEGRFRMCDSPTPANGGEFCVGGAGRSGQGRNCEVSQCLIAAAWSEWSAWSSCSASCGNGVSSRFRVCSTAGACQGSRSERQNCGGSLCLDPPGQTGPVIDPPGETGPDLPGESGPIIGGGRPRSSETGPQREIFG